jgi:uncharacterized protein YukE
MGENKQKIHLLKPSCGNWSVETDGRNVAEVVNFIKGINHLSIKQAATAYSEARNAVETARKGIEEHARKFAEVWEGNASVEAQKALAILYVTMGELADKLNKMATPITDLATVVEKHQAFIDDPEKGILNTWSNQAGGTWDDSIPDIRSVYSGYFAGDEAKTDWWGSQNDLAGQHLKTFAQDLEHVHRMIPDSLEKTLRDIKLPKPDQDPPKPVPFPTDTGPVGNFSPSSYGDPDLKGGPSGPNLNGPSGPDPNGPLPGTNDPTVPGPNGPNGPGTPGSPTTPGNHTPDVPTAPNPGQTPTASGTGTDPRTNLQDFHPPANGTSPHGGTFPGLTTPGSGNPGLPNPGTSGGPGTPGNPGAYGGVGAFGGGAGAASATPAGLRGRSGTGAPGMPFLPMGGMGGGAGQESSDRESTTWLTEDDDVWGSDTDGVVNSKIG